MIDRSIENVCFTYAPLTFSSDTCNIMPLISASQRHTMCIQYAWLIYHVTKLKLDFMQVQESRKKIRKKVLRLAKISFIDSLVDNERASELVQF